MEIINKAILGDCADILPQIEDHSLDLCIIDPPYVQEIHDGFLGRNYLEDVRGMSDGFSTDVLDLIIKKLKKINIYIFCSRLQVLDLLQYFKNKNTLPPEIMTWHKTNPPPCMNNRYLPDTEYIIFARESGVKVYGSYQTLKKFYVTPTNTKDKKLYNHPTVKPLEIIDNLIINSSQEGDVILDCYAGSGTVGVSCVKNNRNYILIEKDKQHYETINNRLNT